MTEWTDEKYVEVWVRLMGYTRFGPNGLGEFYWGLDEDIPALYEFPGRGIDSSRLLDPLNDWNQCMMLVEKMRADGYDLTMWLREPGICIVQIWDREGDGDPLADIGPTGPQRAIIRACALAMEVE